MRPLLLSALFLVGKPAFAEPAAAAAAGYVVKVESGSVYLDLGEQAGALPGQAFTVFTEGEELKHPVTGASLGRLQGSVAEGRVAQVMPLYSVGNLLPGASEVKTGMRAKLGAKKEVPAVAVSAKADGAVGTRAPRWRSPSFDFAISGMALADFKGDGKPTLAVADNKKLVGLYPYPPQQTKPLAQFTIPGVGPRVLSLAAGDLNGNGRAELFVTIYNQTFERVETLVLEFVDGQWKQIGELPWMVRWLQDGSGKEQLAMQQLVADETFPFSTIYHLAFKEGKYVAGEPLRFKRVDFLYDFTQVNLDGQQDPALLYETSTEHLRVQFKDGAWKTPESYGQTPNRLRWHGRMLSFHPQMPAAYENGKAALFLIRNLSALGTLSEPFGLFNGGLIERQTWNGVALATDWKADLGGWSPAVLVAPSADKATDIAVAVTGSAGKSAVWIFDP